MVTCLGVFKMLRDRFIVYSTTLLCLCRRSEGFLTSTEGYVDMCKIIKLFARILPLDWKMIKSLVKRSGFIAEQISSMFISFCHRFPVAAVSFEVSLRSSC